MASKDKSGRVFLPRDQAARLQQPQAEEPIFPGLADAMSMPLWEASQRSPTRSVLLWLSLAVQLLVVPGAILWLFATGPLAWVDGWFLAAGLALWYAVTPAKAIQYWRGRP